MGRPRKFDWDEAARLYAELGTYEAVAPLLGVSSRAIRYALSPACREYHQRYQRIHTPGRGICPDFGGPNSSGRYRIGSRCRGCYALHLASSVRPDVLRCSHCREWKVDGEFPLQRAHKSRRRRHGVCRDCQTSVRRAYRASHPGRDAATQRARRRATT